MRFQVGEMVRVVVARRPEFQGAVVQIVGVGPFPPGAIIDLPGGGNVKTKACGDYMTDAVWVENGRRLRASFMDWQLAKLDPPAEPVSLTRCKEQEDA